MVCYLFTKGLYDMRNNNWYCYYFDRGNGFSEAMELHDMTFSDIVNHEPVCLSALVTW
jgi:hypothetical protein